VVKGDKIKSTEREYREIRGCKEKKMEKEVDRDDQDQEMASNLKTLKRGIIQRNSMGLTSKSSRVDLEINKKCRVDLGINEMSRNREEIYCLRREYWVRVRKRRDGNSKE
jgi:hypothetical protein